MIVQVKADIYTKTFLELQVTGDGMQKRLMEKGWVFPDGFHLTDEMINDSIFNFGHSLPIQTVYNKIHHTEGWLRELINGIITKDIYSNGKIIKTEIDRQNEFNDILEVRTNLENEELF